MPSFTKQDRPEKVKEIYRALKREKPSMPAAMKARISAKFGKPGVQKKGPPYKGPLTKDNIKKTAKELLIQKVAKKLKGLIYDYSLVFFFDYIRSSFSVHEEWLKQNLFAKIIKSREEAEIIKSREEASKVVIISDLLKSGKKIMISDLKKLSEEDSRSYLMNPFSKKFNKPIFKGMDLLKVRFSDIFFKLSVKKISLNHFAKTYSRISRKLFSNSNFRHKFLF